MIKWEFVVDKPIFMALHGLSVKELERRWADFKKYDVLWAGINNCAYLGRWMTEPIDILVYYCTHCECKTHPAKLWVSSSHARGNSLLEFIYQCDENDVKDLVLFGADGYSDNCESGVYESTRPDNLETHKIDCEHFNKVFPKNLKTKIINVSPNSHYEHMPKVSYDAFLADTYYHKWIRA